MDPDNRRQTVRGGARLAFFYVTGRWPKRIAYRDRDPLNLRWRNILECTLSEIMVRARRRSTNKTGFVGVSLDGETGKFRATIMKDGRQYRIGRFNTALAAHRADAIGSALRT